MAKKTTHEKIQEMEISLKKLKKHKQRLGQMLGRKQKQFDSVSKVDPGGQEVITRKIKFERDSLQKQYRAISKKYAWNKRTLEKYKERANCKFGTLVHRPFANL